MSTERSVRTITGRGLPLPGSDIDTDRIIPARFMKAVTFDGLGEHAFHDARFHPDGKLKDHPFNDKRYTGAAILIAGANFGCGSSREHAPQALMRYGIRAILAVSLAEIFAGNCLSIGVPAARMEARDAAALTAAIQAQPQTQITVDLEARRVRIPGQEWPLLIPDSTRRQLVEGTWDGTAVLLANREGIAGVAAKLPYVRGYRV